MASSLNRREWLRRSALAAVGLGAAPELFARPLISSAVFQRECASRISPLAAVRAKLDANENPWGPSDKARQALIEGIGQGNRYAFRELFALRGGIATRDGVKGDHILLGAGSSELLAAGINAYAKGKIMLAQTCYISDGMMGEFPMDKVALTADFHYDLDAMATKADPAIHSLVYVCNPNNPTGQILPADKLRKFIDDVSPKVPILIDEAYIDYAADPKAESMVDKVREGKNVIILRTFSKLHAFAGLRVGYALAKPALLKVIEPFTQQGFGVSVTSAAAGLAALKDTEFQQMTLRNTAESKQILLDGLKKLGYEPLPSSANFVLFPIKMKGQQLQSQLAREGVYVRHWFFNQQPWCRVSIGTADEMKAFVESFAKVVS
jgi:histidinol-phosphate aminotransferase